MDVTCVRPHELEPMKVAMHGATDEVRFAAALFSWGDVARDTVFADAPPSG